MSFNIFTMKSLFSWALKSQAPRKSLQPVQLSRLFSDVTGRAFEEDMSQNREGAEASDMFKKPGKQPGFERSINEVRLLGRVGKDPTIFEGRRKPYVQFPLATSSSNWDNEIGQYNEVTEWHTVVNYNPQKIDSITRFLKKGDRVYVTGKLVYTVGTGTERSCKILLSDFISMYS